MKAPRSTTRLLATIHVGGRPTTFSLPLAHCSQNIQAADVKVLNADVSMTTLGVRFSDGTTREFAVSRTYPAGSETGWIDLDFLRSMDARCPTSIYARARSNGRATVLVYGNMK